MCRKSIYSFSFVFVLSMVGIASGGLIAHNPSPSDGAIHPDSWAALSWTAGSSATSHDVYFGENFDDVDTGTGGTFRGNQVGTYFVIGLPGFPYPGGLVPGKTYYWRIDEVDESDPSSPWKGNVWSLTTADFLIVDDFESYNDLDPYEPNSNRIFLTWIDGWDDPTNGSIVGGDGLWLGPWTLPHGGKQSMPFEYDNRTASYSEATANIADLAIGKDWTIEGVGVLSLWFYGDSWNAPAPMYVAVSNATGPAAVVYHDNPDAALINTWTEWNINLQEFSNQGIVLTNVDWLSIGFGNRNNPQPGGSGLMFIDDIRLYRPPESEPAL